MTKKGETISPETRQRISESLRALHAKKRALKSAFQAGHTAAKAAEKSETVRSPAQELRRSWERRRAAAPVSLFSEAVARIDLKQHGKQIVAQCFSAVWKAGFLSDEVVKALVELAVVVDRAAIAVESTRRIKSDE